MSIIQKEVYQELMREGVLSNKRKEVVQIFYKYGELSGSDVCRIAKKVYPKANTSTFWGRISELKRMGVITEKGEKIDPDTNKKNTTYVLTGNMPSKVAKKKSKDEIIKELRDHISYLEEKLRSRK